MASYSNSRSHILAIMNSSSARAGRQNFLFWHVFYRVHSSFRSFDNYRSNQMDFWGAFECTRLVKTVLHLKTGLLGNQENSIDHNFVYCAQVISNTGRSNHPRSGLFYDNVIVVLFNATVEGVKHRLTKDLPARTANWTVLSNSLQQPALGRIYVSQLLRAVQIFKYEFHPSQ